MSHGASPSLFVDLLLRGEVAALENVLRDVPNVVHVDRESSLIDLLEPAVERSSCSQCFLGVVGDGDVLPVVEASL